MEGEQSNMNGQCSLGRPQISIDDVCLKKFGSTGRAGFKTDFVDQLLIRSTSID